MDEKNNQISDDLLETVNEVEMEFKDHRADDDFERMLAELNGVEYVPRPKPEPEPAEEVVDEQDDEPVTVEPVSKSTEPVKETADTDTEPELQKQPEPEKKPAEKAHESKPEPKTTSTEKPRKLRRPNEIESRKNFERDQKEREDAAKRQRMREIEKERQQNQDKMIDRIADLWNIPQLSEGGTVRLNIKTEDRKEIRVTIPTKIPKREVPVQEAQTPKAPVQKNPAAEPKTIEMKKLTPQQRSAIQEKARSGAAQQTVKPKPPQPPQRPPQPGQCGATNPPRQAKPAPKKPAPDTRKAVPASTAVMTAKNAAAMKKAPVRQQKPADTVQLSADDIRHKQFSIINIIVCCTLFFGLGLFLLFCQRQSGFISSENRNLAEKPKLTLSAVLDGSYFTDLTKWYTDTIPGREELKPVSSKFSNLFGVHLNDVKISNGSLAPTQKETLDPATATTTEVTINTDFTKKSTDTTTKKKKDKSTTTEKLAEVPENIDDGEWIGSVVVSGKGKDVRAMSAFNGTFAAGQFYAETINKYKAQLGGSVNVYTMNMPSSGAYYMPKNLADQFTSQHDCILNIGNNLNGIVNVDVYDALAKHSKEYIYSRTDHHWQPLGAYYAAQVFAEKAKFDFPEITTYEECKIENFVGTMYAYSNYDEELNQNPDTFIYHKPDNLNQLDVYNYDEWFGSKVGAMLFHEYASGVNCYSCIMGTDDIICEIDTPVHNGRTLVIIKDSFGNALVPYLTHGFEKIYVLDFRYFQLNAIDFIEDVGCTDLLFAVSIGAAHTESHVNMIGNLRIQNAGASDISTTTGEPEVVIPDQQETTTAAETAQTDETAANTDDNAGYDDGTDYYDDYNYNW